MNSKGANSISCQDSNLEYFLAKIFLYIVLKYLYTLKYIVLATKN